MYYFPNVFLRTYIICIKTGYLFSWVNFVSSHFTAVVYQLHEFPDRIFKVVCVYSHIISEQQ